MKTASILFRRVSLGLALAALGACTILPLEEPEPLPESSPGYEHFGTLCPQSTVDYSGVYTASRNPRLGCATEKNLRAMLANPNDLRGGRGSKGTAAVPAESVEQHIQGKTPSLSGDGIATDIGSER